MEGMEWNGASLDILAEQERQTQATKAEAWQLSSQNCMPRDNSTMAGQPFTVRALGPHTQPKALIQR